MKKNIILVAFMSAILLLIGCSGPEDGTKILDFPTTESYRPRNICGWILYSKQPDSPDPDNTIVFSAGESFRLYNDFDSSNNRIYIDDAELISSDRSIIEVYNKGFISAKKTGHVYLTLKSKSQDINMTFSAFVMSSTVTARDTYTEISVEVPNGIGAIEFFRKDSSDNDDNHYQIIGSLIGKRGTIIPGTYNFIDYFIEGNKDYDYHVDAYSSSSGYGNSFYSATVKTKNTRYAELKLSSPSFSFDGKKGKFENLTIPDHDSKMNPELYLHLLKDNNDEDIYTFGFEDYEDELDLYNTKNSKGEYIFRNKTFTIKGLDLRFFDNSNPEGCYYWRSVYPVDMKTPKGFPVTGTTEFTVVE